MQQWGCGWGGEAYLTACLLDLISSLSLSLEERGPCDLPLPFSVIKMFIVHGPFWSFLHQSCLKKKTNWENFSGPKASKIKTRAGKMMQATGKALCFSSQQRCVSHWGSAGGDQEGSLLRIWDPLTHEGNLPLVFRRLLSEIEGRLFTVVSLFVFNSKIACIIFFLPY